MMAHRQEKIALSEKKEDIMLEVNIGIRTPLEFEAAHNLEILSRKLYYFSKSGDAWIDYYNRLLREFVCKTNTIIEEHQLCE